MTDNDNLGPTDKDNLKQIADDLSFMRHNHSRYVSDETVTLVWLGGLLLVLITNIPRLFS